MSTRHSVAFVRSHVGERGACVPSSPVKAAAVGGGLRDRTCAGHFEPFSP